MTKAEFQALVDQSACLINCGQPGILQAVQIQLLSQLAGSAVTEAADADAPIGVNPLTYNPAFAAGALAKPAIDTVTGALLVLDRAKDSSTDSILAVPQTPSLDAFVQLSTVAGDTTNYVFSTAIDLADYTAISVLPRVTVAATVAANVFWKFQWSFDNSNWIEDWMPETWTAVGTPAAGERQAPVADGYNTRQFTVATGYKSIIAGATALNIPKRSRYVRIGQKTNATVTGTETVEYHYQLL